MYKILNNYLINDVADIVVSYNLPLKDEHINNQKKVIGRMNLHSPIKYKHLYSYYRYRRDIYSDMYYFKSKFDVQINYDILFLTSRNFFLHRYSNNKQKLPFEILPLISKPSPKNKPKYYKKYRNIWTYFKKEIYLNKKSPSKKIFSVVMYELLLTCKLSKNYILCDCGIAYSKSYIKKHLKTVKHNTPKTDRELGYDYDIDYVYFKNELERQQFLRKFSKFFNKH